MSRKDLEPMIGSRARVSEVLTGRRPLTLEMVRRVKSGLGISADLLILPSSALDASRPDSRIRPAKVAARERAAKSERPKKAAVNG